ncbi:MAG: hypothetical protein GY797_04605 [Deltaproteobacteria bacterium]|nr:hypothetical protein [Deltaproteobacteria bacterium]
MSNYFIGVGGTGQQIALAYQKFAYLCGYEESMELHILDSDGSEEGITREFFADTVIRYDPIEDDTYLFEDIFIRNPKGDVKKILNLLFNEKELSTRVSKGMYGNPSVGATTFINSLTTYDKKEKDQQEHYSTTDKTKRTFDEFMNFIASIGDGSNVVVCGSLAGGTGAGILPILAKHIKEKIGCRVGIIGFLKWFDIDDDSTASKVYGGSGILDNREINEILKVNTESGFCYVRETISKVVDSCVLLGLEDASLKVNSANVGKQEEKRHLITLIAAVVANNFFNGQQLEKGIYSYHIPPGGLFPSHLKVLLPNGAEISIDKIIMMNKAMILFLQLLEEYILQDIPKLTFTPWLVYPTNLRKTIKRISKKIKSKKTEDICSSLQRIIQVEREKIEKLIETKKENKGWFEELCFNTSEAEKGKQGSNLFVFKNEKIVISADNFKETLKNHRPFIFELFNNMEYSGSSDADFVTLIIKHLRVMVYSKYVDVEHDVIKFFQESVEI